MSERRPNVMAAPLPRLRADLDVMPSPVPDQPGLLIRDPFQYSTVTLIIPPILARCLGCFDGEQDEGDLRAALARLTGQVAVADISKRLVTALRDAGFLDDQRFAEMRGARQREFAATSERAPAHSGSGYPDDDAALTSRLRGYFDAAKPAAKKRNRAAHRSEAAMPGGRPPGNGDRIFVVLGTSHYGEPDRFGLTRKPFATPFGVAPTELALVDELAAGARRSVTVEDYCHAVEHSIEFQVVFLQYLYGPRVRILPVLCGAFFAGAERGTLPDS